MINMRKFKTLITRQVCIDCNWIFRYIFGWNIGPYMEEIGDLIFPVMSYKKKIVLSRYISSGWIVEKKSSLNRALQFLYSGLDLQVEGTWQFPPVKGQGPLWGKIKLINWNFANKWHHSKKQSVAPPQHYCLIDELNIVKIFSVLKRGFRILPPLFHSFLPTGTSHLNKLDTNIFHNEWKSCGTAVIRIQNCLRLK